MLDADRLRKKSEEVRKRLELEHQLEVERQQREEQKRIQDEKKRQQQLEQEARFQRMLLREANSILTSMIRESTKGSRMVRMKIKGGHDLAVAVCDYFISLGFDSRIRRVDSRFHTIEQRMGTFMQKLDNSSRASDYRRRFIKVLSSRDETLTWDANINRRLLTLIEEAIDDSSLVLSTDATTYARLTLKPYLQGTADTESDDEWIDINWLPRDVTQKVMYDLHDVPSWILSTGGSALIERISKCANSSAELGVDSASFEMVHLLPKVDRWGFNSMMKLVYQGEPIGVSPFSAEVLCRALMALGFSTSVSNNQEPPHLTISW
jgi:hypothetical protein